MSPLRIGISPCPNDTFAFHGIMSGAVTVDGLDFEIELLDIQQLNEGLAAGRFDFAKASFHAALKMTGNYGVLRAGSALGFGVGPLLLSDHPGAAMPGGEDHVLCPGAGTTATLLMRCLHPEATLIEHRVFHEIMPALRRGEAGYGVVIHEGRFTYRSLGLHLVQDLGERWEVETDGPIPLGGILGSLAQPSEVHVAVNDAIARSLHHARQHPDEALATMRRHAQELDDPVIWQHVDLYVNDFTLDLGTAGLNALSILQTRAHQAGVLPPDSPPLTILG